MVNIIPANPRQNIGSQFGASLGSSFSKGFSEQMKAARKEKQEERKEERLYQRKQQETEKFQQAFQNAQRIYENPELSNQDKILQIYGQFSDKPEIANKLINSLTKPDKAKKSEQDALDFSSGYDAIISNDDDAFQEVIKRSSPETKKSLVDLYNKNKTRSDNAERETRLRIDFITKTYQNAIENERKKLAKNEYMQDEKERSAIKSEIKRLQDMQKKDMKAFKKDSKNFVNLSLWNEIDADAPFSEQNQEERPSANKPVYDPANPEHIQRFQQLKAQFGNDRDRINAAMAEEFD